MAKEKMLWSKDGLHSVRSSKLRSFSVEDWNTFAGNKFRLVGNFNKSESFSFGIFDSQDEALNYLVGIHQIIESTKVEVASRRE